MSELKLGQIIDGDGFRDAIHIAVAPVVASEKLHPGQDVGLCEGSTDTASAKAKPLGIVDPFLKGPVYPEQKFWLFLYPQTVTGMRHEWQHPAFSGCEVATVEEKSGCEQPMDVIARIAEQCGYTAERMIESATAYVETGEYEYDNSETYKNIEGDDWEKFWTAIEAVTGLQIDPSEKRWTFFTCSC